MSVSPESDNPGAMVQQLIARVWRHKWTVASFALLGLLIGVIQANRVTPTYTVTLRVASVAEEQTPGRGADRISGLAALAGIGLPSNGNGIAFELYQAGLTSRSAAEELARQPDFMHTLFAGEWDATAKQWREPPSRTRALKAFVGSMLGFRSSPWHPPDAARVQDALVGMVTVEKSMTTPIVTITVNVPNPEWGRQFLTRLHKAVDGALRKKTLERANRYIAYLDRELTGTNISDVRASLIQTLIDQEKQKMQASSGLDYAADPVESPVASSAPTRPNVFQIMQMYIILFSLAGVATALLLSRYEMTAMDVLTGLRDKLSGHSEKASRIARGHYSQEL